MSLSRSGRSIVYVNEVPYETDVLYTNLYKMVDVSNLAQAVLGGTGTSNATLVSGLIATPNAPANLTINIGSGVVYTLAALDATAYSTIPADTSDFLYKPYTQVNSSFNIAGFTPPGSGALNYLVQAKGLTQDTDPASRPFFNPANPANPIFQTVDQTRYDGIDYVLTSAVSPSIPTPTAGYVGLYVVAVAAGQTAINSGDITVYSAAPFITESLTQKISTATGDGRYARPFQVQNSQFSTATTTGAANTYVISLTPAVTSLVSGLRISAKINVSNTGASTLNVNGLGAVSIVNDKGNQLFSGDVKINRVAEFFYDGTNFVLLNPLSASSLNFVGAVMSMVLEGGVVPQTVTTIFPTYTKLNFNNAVYDPFGWVNTTTRSITVGLTGSYQIQAFTNTLNLAVINNGSDHEIQVNGVNIKRIDQQDSRATASGGLSGSAVLSLNAGDVITLAMAVETAAGIRIPDTSHDSTSAEVTKVTSFSVQYLGDA